MRRQPESSAAVRLEARQSAASVTGSARGRRRNDPPAAYNVVQAGSRALREDNDFGQRPHRCPSAGHQVAKASPPCTAPEDKERTK